MARSLYGKLHRRFGRRMPGPERHRRAQAHVAQVQAKVGPLLAAAPVPHNRTVVVGAGLAGLTAAYYLQQHFAQVLVLEASDRVSGRVHSRSDLAPGRVIEAGGELIGIDHPRWLHFAQSFGLALSVITSEDNFAAAGFHLPIILNGQPVPPDRAEALYREMSRALAVITQEAAAITDPTRPWLAPEAPALDQLTVAERLSRMRLSRLCRAALEAQLANNNVQPTTQQSYLGLLAQVQGGGGSEFWEESEVFRCATGNQSLATALAARLRTPVRLQTPVRAIDITPAVPAAAQVQMGPAIKYLSPVRTRFWISEGRAPSGISDQVGMTWEGTDNQMQSGDQGLVLNLFAGAGAAAAALAAPDPAAYFRPRIEALYPGYSEQATGTPHFAAWPREEYVRTGYSCPAPWQVTTACRLLNERHAGRLVFAGEHVATAFFGFMEGALHSGEMAAERVLDLDAAAAGA